MRENSCEGLSNIKLLVKIKIAIRIENKLNIIPPEKKKNCLNLKLSNFIGFI